MRVNHATFMVGHGKFLDNAYMRPFKWWLTSRSTSPLKNNPLCRMESIFLLALVVLIILQ